MQKLLLFGGSGLLGSRIIDLLGRNFEIISPSRDEVDITNYTSLFTSLKNSRPDLIAYAAGLTKVDEAELNPKLSKILNSDAPGQIARWAHKFGIPVYYFSTDAVFDGKKIDFPYSEGDKTNPVNIYGKTKLMGEKYVLGFSSQNCVLRTISLYSATYLKKKSFPQIVSEFLSRNEEFLAARDQIVNPTFVDDLVWAFKKIIESRSSGIYHIGATNYVSNFEYAQKVAKVLNLDASLVKAGQLDDMFKDKPAKRAKYCWLDTSKFRRGFGGGILHSVEEGLLFYKELSTEEIIFNS